MGQEDNAQEKEKAALVKEISRTLGETSGGPYFQIVKIVRECGIELTATAFKDALEIESQGGLMLPDNSRRRTPGGVFFFLVRSRISEQLRKKIFLSKNKRKASKRVAVEYPAFNWGERLSILEPLLAEQGEISTVKVMLIGRPGKIEMRQDLVITTMSHTLKSATFPKGIPPFPSQPTVYTVYISLKQWQKVEAALADPDDALIVEGVGAFDPEIQAMAIYASKVTTKVLDAKRREEKGAKAASNDEAPSKSAETPAKLATAKKPAKPPVAKTPEKPASKSRIAGTIANTPAAPAPQFVPPTGMPPEEVQRLTGLYASASLFRQKISTIQTKPLQQQSGLEMTQKLLKGVEDQIAALEKKYS